MVCVLQLPLALGAIFMHSQQRTAGAGGCHTVANVMPVVSTRVWNFKLLSRLWLFFIQYTRGTNTVAHYVPHWQCAYIVCPCISVSVYYKMKKAYQCSLKCGTLGGRCGYIVERELSKHYSPKVFPTEPPASEGPC